MDYNCDLCNKFMKTCTKLCKECEESMVGIGATARKLMEHLLKKIETLEERMEAREQGLG